MDLGKAGGTRLDSGIPSMRERMMHDRDLQMLELRRYSTPTLANALECFGIDPTTGYTDASVACVTPELGPVVGYAATATIVASRPASASEPGISHAEYLQYLESCPSPAIAVMEDADPHPIGSFWGEVMGNAHKALGRI